MWIFGPLLFYPGCWYLKLNRIDEKNTYMLKRILLTVESCLDIFDSTYIECFMNKIVTLGSFPKMIVRMCVVTKPSTRWTQCHFCTTLVLSICRDYGNDELLAAFECVEIRSYQFVAQDHTVTDETDESGGSGES